MAITEKSKIYHEKMFPGYVSSGIGLGVAREFARAGADVAGCSLSG